MLFQRFLAAGLSLLGSSFAFSRDFVLTDATDGVELANWTISSAELGINSRTPFTVTKKTLHGGRQDGSTLITIEAGALTLEVVPTRGMGLYRARAGDVVLGWNSPVDEIVHPSFINLEQRGGLGWLDGFNEMMVRCGYEWTGHPGMEDGRLMSLHGRFQNIPASKVIVSVEERTPYRITVKGLVKEKTFKFSDLETWAGVSVVPGEKRFIVHDELTNKSDYEREYQIIYHSNFGAPILEGGARFNAAVAEISPFNDYARKGLADWQTYLAPTPGYDEMVFNIKPYADGTGHTLAMLSNQAGTRGVAAGFNVAQLPVLTLWKNTDSAKQGYVTGIEPGTSYAYARQIERAQGRIAKIGPGATKQFDLEYTILDGADAVKRTEAEIAAIQAGRKTELVVTPMARE